MKPGVAAVVSAATGVTLPMAHAQLRRPGAPGRGRRVFVCADVVNQVARDLGRAYPVAGLTRTQVMALAAVFAAVDGIDGPAQLAARCGVAYNTAARALRDLEAGGWVHAVSRMRMRDGKASRVTVTVPTAKAWASPRITSGIARVRSPAKAAAVAPAIKIPREFWHLFWNSDPAHLDVREHGTHIALRMLEKGDIEAAAWALTHVPTAQLERIEHIRGVDPRIGAFVRSVLRTVADAA